MFTQGKNNSSPTTNSHNLIVLFFLVLLWAAFSNSMAGTALQKLNNFSYNGRVIGIKGLRALHMAPHPSGMALNRDGSLAYISVPFPSMIEVLDINKNAISSRIMLPLTAFPSAVAFTPNGNIAYVLGSKEIYVIDVAHTSVAQTISFPGYSNPLGVAFSPAGRKAYIATEMNNMLSINVINVRTGTLERTLPVGHNEGSIGHELFTISKNGEHGYILGSSRVFSINLNSGKVVFITKIKNLTGGMSIGCNQDNLYITAGTQGMDGLVYILSAQTGKTIRVIKLGYGPQSAYSSGKPFGVIPTGVACSNNPKLIYVTTTVGVIAIIDQEKNKVIGKLPIYFGGSIIGITSDDEKIISLSSATSNMINMFIIATGAP